MSYVPEKLRQASDQVEKGNETSITVRQFLAWFGRQRRGWLVVYQIQEALKSVKLRTAPDFQWQWMDGYITLKRSEPASELADTGLLSTEPPQETQKAPLVAGGASEDPTYRIGRLEAANNTPVFVRPDAPLNEAVTIMLREEYSQLPVMTSERDVKGAVTWRSITKRLFFGAKCETVQECADRKVEIVDSDVSLFRVIEHIANNDFVLVRDAEKKISGIVTAADLGECFYLLAQPFLLLSETENHLRGLIDGKFTLEELLEARKPDDSDRDITAVSDLTFGEYVRLLQNPAKWEKVALGIDRVTFVKNLERTNNIRNDVMHFDPDGLGPDDLEFLRKEARFLQELRTIVGV